MANKRMFSREILEHDNFTRLSHSAMVLYFYLNMAADNEGFVNNKYGVMRSCKCTDSDLQELESGGWIILFDTGVLVITHWRMHNTLKNDRCNSIYEREKSLLKCVNKVYFLAETVRKEIGNTLEENWSREERSRGEAEKRGKEIEDEYEGEEEGEVQEGKKIVTVKLPNGIFSDIQHVDTKQDKEACIDLYKSLVKSEVYPNYQRKILNIAEKYGAYTFMSAISLLRSENLDYSLSNIESICYAAKNGLSEADVCHKTKSR